ncbi:MAG: NFACT family protein [Lachnospiraceae bacterium]|nr:NFACT family protein [Lachnospiraceae bacterium]
MAFDGITIASLVKEFESKLVGGRLYKIAQPEPDELLITIKSGGEQYRLVLSASPSLPLIYLTDKNKPSPMTAPNFCMLLRKHLQNGRIVSVTQPGLERAVHFQIEHFDEMGDLCQKTLIVEVMGKHSNIIFCNADGTIIDSIKRVSALVSSVREVLPGKAYFMPQTVQKAQPLSLGVEQFVAAIQNKPMPIYKAIYTSLVGISPIMAQELCYRAKVDGEVPVVALDSLQMARLAETFVDMVSQIRDGQFAPCVAYHKEAPVEFGALTLSLYDQGEYSLKSFDSMSALVEQYYAEKDSVSRIRQKSADLRKIVQTALERNIKKYDLQLTQMKDTEKREQFRIYGELINTYGYGLPEGSKSLEALNYYTNEMITIPLDETLSPKENAQKYFDKYAKMKRTYEALVTLTEEVKGQIEHLESIMASLDIAQAEEDLVQIREELVESGYVRRKAGKKEKVTSKPFHYISSDGFDIYVGKNNYQNDELTFKFATGNDWWFHAKGMAGSHVIVKTGPDGEMPDATFEDAARLAAFYSKGKGQDKVEVDYIQKKHVKKPAGANPGFVVYYTNYSMMIDTDISGIRQA